MAKQIKFDAEARQKILAGVEKLSNAVTSTLGPSGRNVILDKKFGSPRSPRTASPSPRRSSCPIRSRTWARRW